MREILEAMREGVEQWKLSPRSGYFSSSGEDGETLRIVYGEMIDTIESMISKEARGDLTPLEILRSFRSRGIS